MAKLQHVISADQFHDTAFLDELFASARQMEEADKARRLSSPLSGRILATLFYEPSTRTRLSFEAAMLKLGGSVLTVENAQESSSAAKGESIADTIRVVSGYADAIAIRHFQEGSARAAAEIASVPVINAGDGAGEHPSQALMDIYTIQRELGQVAGVRIALVGDLLNGRTIHSLLPLLALYPDVTVDLVAPPELELPQKYITMLRDKGVKVQETPDLEPVVASANVVYVTRVQKERFASVESYDRVKDVYVMSHAIAERLKGDAIIMHALPRVNEIAPEVDTNARAAYFRQARNGLYVRMALLQHLLG